MNILQARVGFQSELFEEYVCDNGSIKFAINLAILIDCLHLFGTSSETTTAIMSYSVRVSELLLTVFMVYLVCKELTATSQSYRATTHFSKFLLKTAVSLLHVISTRYTVKTLMRYSMPLDGEFHLTLSPAASALVATARVVCGISRRPRRVSDHNQVRCAA